MAYREFGAHGFYFSTGSLIECLGKCHLIVTHHILRDQSAANPDIQMQMQMNEIGKFECDGCWRLPITCLRFERRFRVMPMPNAHLIKLSLTTCVVSSGISVFCLFSSDISTLPHSDTRHTKSAQRPPHTCKRTHTHAPKRKKSMGIKCKYEMNNLHSFGNYHLMPETVAAAAPATTSAVSLAVCMIAYSNDHVMIGRHILTSNTLYSFVLMCVCRRLAALKPFLFEKNHIIRNTPIYSVHIANEFGAIKHLKFTQSAQESKRRKASETNRKNCVLESIQ